MGTMEVALLAPFSCGDRDGFVTLGVDGSVKIEHTGPTGMDGAELHLTATVPGYTPALTLAGLRDEERLDALALIAACFAALVEYATSRQRMHCRGAFRGGA
jgi:hypothetical protein